MSLWFLADAGRTEKSAEVSGVTKRASWLLAGTILSCGSIALPSQLFAQQAPAPAATQSRAVRFSIPAQSLPAAIDAFIRASGWQVGYSSRIADGVMSKPVAGTMPPAQALQTLLAGTGITVRLTGPTTAANGTATVAFTINRSGTVTSARLVASSGDAALDAEAVSLPRRASPVPEPPANVSSGTIALAVPIRFSR